jgi:hypothetical protein
LVKGQRFQSWRSVGHALQAARIHNARGVDELILLDIAATPEGRGPNLDLVRKLADECFIPLTGGGIWIPLRGDAVAGVGTAPVTANPASFGGAAHGTYTHRAGRVQLIFVLESGIVANVLRCALIPIQRDYT